MFPVRLPRELCQDEFSLVEPQINAEGVHIWPFEPGFPIDVQFLTSGRSRGVRLNRHDFFELMYQCAGTTDLRIQERSLTLEKGDLAVIGSTLYHRVTSRTGRPITLGVLFFEPRLIQADSADSAEYLTPFLMQDAQFPHVIGGSTGLPKQVFDLMQRIRAELPAATARQRLAVKTYLKMILILLVNQYASHARTIEVFNRQQRALDRLRPLFAHIEKHYDEPIPVKEAARFCRMSNSHFAAFFKKVTGQSFTVYLNHCRVERAQSLLLTTDRSISEISQAAGFCDQSYFGTVFRRLIGVTPASYRRRFQTGAQSAPAQ